MVVAITKEMKHKSLYMHRALRSARCDGHQDPTSSILPLCKCPLSDSDYAILTVWPQPAGLLWPTHARVLAHARPSSRSFVRYRPGLAASSGLVVPQRLDRILINPDRPIDGLCGHESKVVLLRLLRKLRPGLCSTKLDQLEHVESRQLPKSLVMLQRPRSKRLNLLPYRRFAEPLCPQESLSCQCPCHKLHLEVPLGRIDKLKQCPWCIVTLPRTVQVQPRIPSWTLPVALRQLGQLGHGGLAIEDVVARTNVLLHFVEKRRPLRLCDDLLRLPLCFFGLGDRRADALVLDQRSDEVAQQRTAMRGCF